MSEEKSEKTSYPKPTLVKLKIKDVKIPEIRVSAVMPEELAPLFAESVKAAGVLNPISVIWDGENYVLVDGLHRLLEIRNKGEEEIDAVVVNGSMRDVMIRNLQTGRLQGRGKVSDEIRVIKYLNEEEQMGLDEIALRTGYPMRRVEDLLSIAKADPEILEALDKEELSLGAALEIARIPDRDAQLTVLYQAVMYRLKVKDVKDLVDRTLIMLKTKQERMLEEERKPTKEEVLISCWLCGEQWRAADMRGFVLCPTCAGMLFEWKARLKHAPLPSEPEGAGAVEEEQKQEEKQGEKVNEQAESEPLKNS
jgi:ParB-like chromosome segregation protein Spo0J